MAGSGLFEYIVDNIMLTNYYTLRYIASTLSSSLEGKEITGAFSQEKDQLVVSFRGFERSLIVACRPNLPAIYLTSGFARARKNSVDVLRNCRGRYVQKVAMHTSDRIMSLVLDGGVTLKVFFFGTTSNVLFVDEALNITDAFRESRRMIGTKWEESTQPLLYDVSLLEEKLKEDEPRPAVAIVKDVFPTFGPLLSREVLHRAAIAPHVQADKLLESDRNRMGTVIRTLLAELASAKPRIYWQEGEPAERQPAVFSIIKLSHLTGVREEIFDDVHHAIRLFVSHRFVRDAFERKKSAIARVLEKELEHLQTRQQAIGEELLGADRADDYERFGSLLMSALGSLEKGMKSIALDGRHIQLDPTLTPVRNAQRYFEKARKARLAAANAKERGRALQERAREAESLLALLESVSTGEEMKEFMNNHEESLDKFGLGEKSKEREALPFRAFTVDGGFQVLAGKSSTNNDLLTMKHAKPQDLWFHARGSSGSHVVLKVGSGKGQPGKKAREQAAAIAAYYSKMRSASVVPVAMTERKYVRKPKGSPAGTVVLEREKVIFAEPALPQGEKD
jgi:predicted ribosome quality control (RQC) complex YloA/Tae2 family protein